MLEPMLSDAVHDGILDGRLVAARLRQQVRLRVADLAEAGHTLTLALVRVGDDPASAVYVTHKVRACAEVGIASEVTHLPSTRLASPSSRRATHSLIALSGDGYCRCRCCYCWRFSRGSRAFP